MTQYHLAQLNVGRLNRPLEHEATAEFVAALDPVNALAEATPGFIWRLTDDAGNSSLHVDLPGNDDPLLIVNYSIWANLDSLKHFMYQSGHAIYLRRRRDWFAAVDEATSVCWWVPADLVPDIATAYGQLEKLHANGPTPEAFTVGQSFPPPTD